MTEDGMNMRDTPRATYQEATQQNVPPQPTIPTDGTAREATIPDGRGVREAAAAPYSNGQVVQTTQVLSPEDRVRWGPVWAGLLTALTLFLVLELLAYGLGLLTTTTSSGVVTASDASPWISGILGLIAFFVGGFVTERSSAARGSSAGLLNGFMVWALGTTLILLLSTLGLGALFGALGSAIAQVIASGSQISLPNGGGVNPNRVSEISQSVALGAFASLVLSAIAAALGGLLGSMGSATGRLTPRGSMRE